MAEAAGGHPAAFLFSLERFRWRRGEMGDKVLRRSRENRMVAGVLAGLARYYDIDVSLLRIVYVVLSVCSAAFPGLLVYLLMWVIIPLEEPGGREA
jgi:phage shock protein C